MKFSVVCGKYLPELAVGGAVPAVSSAHRTSTQTDGTLSKEGKKPHCDPSPPSPAAGVKRKLEYEQQHYDRKTPTHRSTGEENNNTLIQGSETPSRKRICNRNDSLGTLTIHKISSDTYSKPLGTLDNGPRLAEGNIGTLDRTKSSKRDRDVGVSKVVSPDTILSASFSKASSPYSGLGTLSSAASSPHSNLGTSTSAASSPHSNLGTSTSKASSLYSSLGTLNSAASSPYSSLGTSTSAGSSPPSTLGTLTSKASSPHNTLGTSKESASQVHISDRSSTPCGTKHSDFIQEHCNQDHRPSGMLGLLNMSIPVMSLPAQMNLRTHPVSHSNAPLYWDSQPNGSFFKPLVYLSEPQLLMMPLSAWPSHDPSYGQQHASTGLPTYPSFSPETAHYRSTSETVNHRTTSPKNPTYPRGSNPRTSPHSAAEQAKRLTSLSYQNVSGETPTYESDPKLPSYKRVSQGTPTYPWLSPETVTQLTRETSSHTNETNGSADIQPFRLYSQSSGSRYFSPESSHASSMVHVTPGSNSSPTDCYRDPVPVYPVIKQEAQDPSTAYGYLRPSHHPAMPIPSPANSPHQKQSPDQAEMFSNHTATMCAQEKPERGQYQCRWIHCTAPEFPTKDELIDHVNRTHVQAEDAFPSAYICRWIDCARKGRSFNARYKMLVHVRCHTQEKPHECCQCGKRFSRLENLKIHHRTHTGERPYLCTYTGCSKAFSNSSDRFKHQRTHIVPKPYPCRVHGCCKSYTDPSSLRKHSKTHEPREFSINASRAAKMNFVSVSELSRLATGLPESRVLDEVIGESRVVTSRVANETSQSILAERSRFATSRVADEAGLSRAEEPSRVATCKTDLIFGIDTPQGEDEFRTTDGQTDARVLEGRRVVHDSRLANVPTHGPNDVTNDPRTMKLTEIADVSSQVDDRLVLKAQSLSKGAETRIMSQWLTTLTQDKPLDLTTNTI